MPAVPVQATMGKRVLVARESAHLLSAALDAALVANPKQLTLDFANIDIINPSFFDELLRILEAPLTRHASPATLVITNSSSDLSDLATIGSSYGLRIDKRGRDWVVTRKLKRSRSSLGP
jgi:STAS-like domain of unknown function (DUF4325)